MHIIYSVTMQDVIASLSIGFVGQHSQDVIRGSTDCTHHRWGVI